MTQELNIIYEDHHLIAVNKPARLLTASDASGDKSLLAFVRDWNVERQLEGRKGYCVPLHFLDRPVSGLVVFALSSKAATRLSQQFRERSLEKTYYAIVEGVPQKSHGTLIHKLYKDKDANLVKISNHPEAKLSKLRYEVLAEYQSLSWIKVIPETGRSHQIRVQLASLGTPIYGDKKYGAQNTWDNRIALHAAQLSIKHPVKAEIIDLRAPLDEAWQRLWPRPFPFTSELSNETSHDI